MSQVSLDSKKSNKIIEIVKLQQILKKWKKVAKVPKHNASINRSSSSSSSNLNGGSSNKSIKFLRKTLSFSDRNLSNSTSGDIVAPKGYVVISVGQEEKRFIIKTEHLGHQAFEMLLSEAEEEYGFQQEGVLKLPCQVSVFEQILKIVEEKNSDSDLSFMFFNGVFDEEIPIGSYYSPDLDHDIAHSSHQFQMCT